MSCCKGGSKINGESDYKGVENPFKKLLGAIFSIVVGTLLMPVLWVLFCVALYNGWFGDGFDVSKFIGYFAKKKKTETSVDEEEEGEFNEDEYETTNVEKI